MDNPDYMTVNPMYMDRRLQKHGPIKIIDNYVEDKSDIKSYYMRSILCIQGFHIHTHKTSLFQQM